MNFQQLLAIIPLVERVASFQESHTVDCPDNGHALLVVRQGHVTVAYPDQEPIVCSQGFACHPLYAPYRIEVPKTKEAEYVIIRYRVLPDHSLWMLHGPLSTVSEAKIRYMLDELLRTIPLLDGLSEDAAALQRFKMRAMLERVLFIFLYESRFRNKRTSAADAIDETLSYINEHYMNKLTLPLLAERAGMSEGHYTVLFKKHTGMTMTAYLRKLRIEKASIMLRQTRLSAKEVAQRTGFSDYFHFSRVFKQEEGLSPTAYQQSRSQI
ncbi:helix-turn-helix domain-containing protein [Cohnella suwonensis]|uniref:Helix-turn-helix domain-containing protein n=1 Tax=Cohnella suwonensis TaxID=696072 RepID=A0ABW0LTT5_9BACL